jgi:tetratricopeptide (TPR) repeat protein
MRAVAVKVVAESLADESLLREARMAARLQHDSIVAVYDVLEAHGRLHIVMERLRGPTLAETIRDRPPSPQVAADLVRRILQAVQHAHGEGVIHCDLKPANVVVLPDGGVKVLDFGLARFESRSASGLSAGLAGTPRYLAPERLLGEPPSARTDVYSIGVILSDLLGEAAPSPSPRPDSGRPELALCQELRGVAGRAMSPVPADRYGSARDMLAALERAVAGRLDRRPRWRVGARFAAAAAVLAVAITAAGIYVWGPPQPGARPILAIEMAAIGADPLARHVAAALEQLVMGALAGSEKVVLVRPAQGPATMSESGATHVLAGTVRRAGGTIEISLGLRGASDDAVLASQTTRASLDNPQEVATNVVRSTDALLRRAGLALTTGDVDSQAVRRALSVNPQAFEEYAQAREYMRTPEVVGNADHAIALLGSAIERDPAFVLAHAALAEAHWLKYQSTRDRAWTDRARTSALEALRLNPGEPSVRYTLAVIYRGMGRLQDALTEVSAAREMEPSSDDVYRLRGRVHADLGRLDEALEDLKTARELRPGYWDNHRTTGLVLYEAARYDDAVTHFQRVAELRPNNASAFQTLGTALHAAGRIPEALEAYQRALAIAPSANTYSNVAKIHFDQGRFDAAREAYEESARIQPKEPLTHRNLGDTYIKLGQPGRARTAFETAIALANAALEVNRSDLSALSLQAICHAKLGHRAEALKLASVVLANEGVSPIVRYRSAVAVVLAGDRERGVDELVRAISDGYSRSEAATDDDLESVAADPRVRAVLQGSDR